MPELDRRLADWFGANRRELPWRGSNPWGVFVSEIMLQQTPVSRALPAWTGWLERWPTPTDLADDSPGEAVRVWDRLGYPRRALRMHAAATIMRDRHDGEVPTTEEDLLALPGVGEYTAAAVRAFAFGQPAVVVDINVRRFLCRVLTGRDPAPSYSAAERALAEHMVASLDVPQPEWAAASMEFGALVCTARNPACDTCPLSDLCHWAPSGYAARPRPRYEGSDRQVRGLVLAAAREAPVADVAHLWHDQDQLQRALESLHSDGLLVHDGTHHRLPG